MPDKEIDDALDGNEDDKGGQGGQGGGKSEVDKGEERPEKRIKGLNKKLEQTELEKQKLAEENAKLKFDNEFKDISSTYPLAKDHRADIEAKVKSGYTVEDATISVLTKNKKLLTSDEIKRKKAEGENLGGSADINESDLEHKEKSVAEMTQKERLAALREEEKKGNVILS